MFLFATSDGFETPPGPVPDGGHSPLLFGDTTEVHCLQMRKDSDYVVSNNTGMNK